MTELTCRSCKQNKKSHERKSTSHFHLAVNKVEITMSGQAKVQNIAFELTRIFIHGEGAMRSNVDLRCARRWGGRIKTESTMMTEVVSAPPPVNQDSAPANNVSISH